MRKDPSYRKKIVPTSKGKIAYGVVRINGKDIYLGKWNSKASQQEYDRVIGEWRAAGRTTDDTEVKISVSEICIDYMREMRKRYRDSQGKPTNELATVQRVMKDLRKHYGRTTAFDFKALRFKAMREILVSQKLCRSVVNKYCRHIIRAFKFASENEKLSPENYQSMKAVESLRKGKTEARETGPIAPIPIDVIQKTLEHLHKTAADMVNLQLLTGMRPGELCQLKPEDIDTTGDIWVFTPETHKNQHRGQSRQICIGNAAQAILKPYLHRDGKSHCFSPMEAVEQMRRRRRRNRTTPEHQGNSVGTNRKHGRRGRRPADFYTTSSYRKAIHRACDAAGIDRWSPNRIRKTAGTLIRKETGSLEAAQAVLGHKSRSTTEKFYAEIDNSVAAEVMRKIG